MMKVLVTGAGGFIGGHLMARLAERGIAATGIVPPDRPVPGGEPTNGGRNWIRADVRNVDKMAGVAVGHDAVIHLAASYPLVGAPDRPLAYVQDNVLTTAAMLEATRRARVNGFVLASTAQVYGLPRELPLYESHPLDAVTVYGASKIGAEALVRAYAHQHGLRALNLRLFNVYGPRQRSANVIATIAAQALGAGPVSVFSTNPERDYVYVGDVADALIAAIRCSNAHGEALNIGTGVAVSVGELAGRILRIAGSRAAIHARCAVPPEPGCGPDRVVADISAAARILGWRPVTDLDRGLEITLNWMTRNPAG